MQYLTIIKKKSGTDNRDKGYSTNFILLILQIFVGLYCLTTQICLHKSPIRKDHPPKIRLGMRSKLNYKLKSDIYVIFYVRWCKARKTKRDFNFSKDERRKIITHRCTRRTVRRGVYCATVIAYTYLLSRRTLKYNHKI